MCGTLVVWHKVQNCSKGRNESSYSGNIVALSEENIYCGYLHKSKVLKYFFKLGKPLVQSRV